MNNQTIAIGRGDARDFVLQSRDAQGDAFAPITNPTPFLIGDTLTCKVWAGDETAAILTPTVVWNDVTIGTVTLSFANVDTSTVALGTYRLRITATRGAKTAPIISVELTITATPGTQTVGLAYTVLDDLIDYADWLEDLQSDRDIAGFARQQYRATEDLIQILVTRWQPQSLSLSLGQPGFNAVSLYGGGTTAQNKWLRDQITPAVVDGTHPANPGNARIYSALLIRPITLEYCAKKAISYICEKQIGRNADRDFQALGRFYRRDANEVLKSYVAEIDLSIPQTGYSSISINCGVMSLR